MTCIIHRIYKMNDEFQIVTKRKRSRRKAPLISAVYKSGEISHNSVSIEKCLRLIQEARSEICSSAFFKSFKESLEECISHLGQKTIQEILCLGLGNVCQSLVSRYQFALALCLKDLYSLKVQIYDPVFTRFDRELLEYFDCIVLEHNFEGKFKIPHDFVTIVYLPHCPKQLTNNFLWANWGLSLSNCICIANSFSTIIEKTSHRVLIEEADYIYKISSYTLESSVCNSFKHYEVFNDLAFHVFPTDKILSVPDNFWKSSEEPRYLADNLELICNSTKHMSI